MESKNHKMYSRLQNKYFYFYFIFIRWIHEGHLHINRVNLFLPVNSKHGIKFNQMVPSSRNILNIEFHMLLKHLKAEQLPNIDLKKILTRFSDELQLPSDYYFSINNFLFIVFISILIFLIR